MSDELTTLESGIVLRGQKLSSLRHCGKRLFSLLMKDTWGLVKTKQLIREKVWFPGIDLKADNLIKNCLTCLMVIPTCKQEPLGMSKLPAQPWTEVSTDFAEILTDTYLLVVIDDLSHFPAVEDPQQFVDPQQNLLRIRHT